MTPNPLRLQELLTRLIEGEVRFVLVGGLAVNAWGFLRATQDVDVVPDPASENLERLDSEVDVDGLVVRVCSLEHLRQMKRSSSRPRDREDLEALEATQEPREGGE